MKARYIIKINGPPTLYKVQKALEEFKKELRHDFVIVFEETNDGQTTWISLEEAYSKLVADLTERDTN